MKDTLFWTFSTVAQTIGTAFAFVGALVLYRLGTLTRLLRADGEAVVRAGMPSSQARQKELDGQEWDKFIEAIEDIGTRADNPPGGRTLAFFDRMKRSNDRERRYVGGPS